MELHVFSLRPRSAFGTPLAGDTLFGQLCWAVRERWGEVRLRALLEGYTDGQPFLVSSDGFPSGFLPRPPLPDFMAVSPLAPQDRKAARRRQWLPVDRVTSPVHEWASVAVDLAASEAGATRAVHGTLTVQTQNTINRLTGTTGTGPFAPRQVTRLALGTAAGLDLYVAIDVARISLDEVTSLLTDIGVFGFGRDASTGLGKFDLGESRPVVWPVSQASQVITLAPCAPNVEQLDPTRCFYQPQTRFGRHGNLAVHGGNPFKKPLLYLKSAAFLTYREPSSALVHGTGFGGLKQPISYTLPETVHQGYAPVVPVNR
jgi:CRISPR-associated protein Csm4